MFIVCKLLIIILNLAAVAHHHIYLSITIQYPIDMMLTCVRHKHHVVEGERKRNFACSTISSSK